MVPPSYLSGAISSFPASEDWLYLATVLYPCSKELIGHGIAQRNWSRHSFRLWR
jgi:hypothetical protein